MAFTREPGHVEVAVGNHTRTVFTDEERHRLTQILLNHFKRKEYDEGLLEGVRYVRSALAAKPREGGSAAPAGSEHPRLPHEPRGTEGGSSWSPWHWLGLGLAVLLGIWLLSAVGRTLSSSLMEDTVGPPATALPAAVSSPAFSAACSARRPARGATTGSPAGRRRIPPRHRLVSAPGPEDTDYTADGGDFDTADGSGGDDDHKGDDSQEGESSGGVFGGGNFGGGDFGGDDGGGGDF